MIFFRRAKKRVRAEARLLEIGERIQELDGRFRHMEEHLEHLFAKFPQITVENLHIHQPVLERLEFRLDALDIETLSGSLNLGNNFGVKPGSPGTQTPAGNTSPAQSKPPAPGAGSPDVPGLHRTPSGFRLNNRR